MELFVKNDKLKESMTESGEMNHLGEIWAFEEDTLRKYWGHYYEPEQQVKQQFTTSAILNTYMKLRPVQLVNSLMNPSNPNYFYKRDILWQWLAEHEADYKLPFKSADGREGKPFVDAMSTYKDLYKERREK